MLGLGLLGMAVSVTPVEAASFAYVTNLDSDTVTVIDTATNTVVATIPVGPRPAEVAITPNGAFAYVTKSGFTLCGLDPTLCNTVLVIATATNTVVAKVPVGNNPLGVAITPDGAFAYVTNFSSNTVSVIATATNTVVATVPVGRLPSSVAITPDGTLVYVVNADSNTVSVIATATNTVVATMLVGLEPLGVAITPDGAFAYVTIPALSLSNTVVVIATATNTVVATITVEDFPVGVAITPDGAFAYVTNFGSNTVSVIATATNTVVATIPVGVEPSSVAFTPDGAFAYVTNEVSNTVVVIHTATNTVVATIPVGPRPADVAITPAMKPGNKCPLGQGFWKNHPDTWPLSSVALGSQTYTQAELLALFDTLPNADASVILAHQLIAAKLNIANGSNPAPISSTIADADSLLGQFFGKLPYNVDTSSVIGQQMVNDASVLDRYNNGDLTPDCKP
jgi:YVTN family beta-propeller protein